MMPTWVNLAENPCSENLDGEPFWVYHRFWDRGTIRWLVSLVTLYYGSEDNQIFVDDYDREVPNVTHYMLIERPEPPADD